MAFTGALAFPTPTPPPHRRGRTKARGDAIFRPSSAAATPVPHHPSPPSTGSSVPVEQPKVGEFSYTRATPSVRWPGLKLEDYIPNSSTPSEPQFPPPSSALHLLDPELVETPSEPAEKIPHGDEPPPETLDDKQSRTRGKKMSKLALKRAKDWRQRVQLLTDRVLGLGPSEFVADVLDQRAVQMTPTDYCFVVKWVGRSSWQRALEVYEWLNLRRWYAPNARMLATIISVLGRAHQEALAEEVFRRAESADVSAAAAGTATVQVYNAMMGVYARAGKFSRVQEMLRLMRERGCEPDLVSFNTLINSKAKSGQMPPGTAVELLNEVRRSKLRPDAITYNTLISACSYGSNLEEAMNIYKDMEASNCQPDLWTYNAMVSVYGRCGMTREAERLFFELGEKGFCPDAVTYNSLVYAFAREGNVEKVERVCAKMVGAGFKKDEITYNTIIHMYGKQGRHDLAFQLYRDMKLNGCKPDAVTYTVLIDLLGKADRITEAANVMSDMLNSGVRPTLRTFSALICGYAKAGMRVEAEQTFDHMLRSGIKPDCLAYSVVLDILLRFNETRKAIVLYRDMVRDEFKPDSGLYQVLIGVLAKENKQKDIEDLVKDMREICRMSSAMISSILVKGGCFDLGAAMLKEAVVQGHDPDDENLLSILNAYNSSGRHDEAHALLDFLRECAPNSRVFLTEASITMLCNNQQLEAAKEEYNKMRWSGFKSFGRSHTVYESLIMGCEKSESFPEACQIFSDMKFYGLKPSHNIYRSVLSIYCRISFPETAHSLLDEAERSGILFDDVSLYVTLIETYGKLKLWQRAESLVGKLRLQSTVDRKVWNALIDAYAESGRYEQARAIFNTMVRDGPSPSVDSVNGLMKALIVDGRLDELYVVIEELQDMDFKISKSTILLMLDAFAGARNIFEVKKIYHGMKAAGYLPTMHVYRSMVSLLSHGKRVSDVESIVAEMEEAGFKSDLTIFNSLLRMYTRIGDFKKATEVYQRIQEAGFQADEETYNSIILMYSRERRPEEGLSLLSEMKKQGLEPKLDTYQSLLAACGREKLWEQAEDIFESIQSMGCRLNRSVYHTMMKIYRDCGNHSRAEHVLFLMKQAGVEPTIATMHMLMVSYGTAGQPQEAENVLNNLKRSGLDLSTLPYASVIDSYLKNGDYNMGVEKLLGMKREGVEPDHRIWTCFIRAASLCQQTSEAMDLLNSLRDTGFDIPIRLLTQKTESLVVEADLLLENLGSEDNASFNFVNALVDLLWAFDRRATASWVFQLAIRKGIYRHDLFRVANKDWGADFRKLSAGAALVGLTLWLDHMQDASLQGMPESPKSVVLITGTAEYHMVSLNNTLKAYLWEMGSPFLPCKTRTGVLVAKAHSLRMWLKDSSFCMDLELKDAPVIPKSNSMQLTEGYFMRAGLVPAFKEIHDRMGQVRPKKFARLALLSDERRDKAITADLEGRKEKLEKIKRRGGVVRARRPKRLRTSKFMRRQHQHNRE